MCAMCGVRPARVAEVRSQKSPFCDSQYRFSEHGVSAREHPPPLRWSAWCHLDRGTQLRPPRQRLSSNALLVEVQPLTPRKSCCGRSPADNSPRFPPTDGQTGTCGRRSIASGASVPRASPSPERRHNSMTSAATRTSRSLNVRTSDVHSCCNRNRQPPTLRPNKPLQYAQLAHQPVHRQPIALPVLTSRTRDGYIVTAYAHMFRNALKAWVLWHEQKEDEAIARMMHL